MQNHVLCDSCPDCGLAVTRVRGGVRCPLRTQQCVELLSELVLCQFVFVRSPGAPSPGGWVCWSQFLLESLILAQDERWRRA